jgi:hypothetical protein
MTPASPFGSAPFFDGRVPSAEALRAIEAHPHLPAALRMMASGGVAIYRGNRIVNILINDRARFLIGVFAIHLHHVARPADPRSGATLGRIKALCVEQKVCSGGRAEAMLVLMRMFGYLASAPSGEDRRLHRLVPTDELIAWHRARLALTLEAITDLMPEAAQARAALHAPGFVERLMSHFARVHLPGFYYVDHVPEMKLFFERNAGVPILFSIMLTCEAGDSFPPRGPVAASLANLARQFGVSRSHVRRMLTQAIDSDLMERDESRPDCFRLLPALHVAFTRLMAMYILHVAHTVRAALAEIEPQSEVA